MRIGSYVRFFVRRVGPGGVGTVTDLARARAFRPLSPSDEEDSRAGWCSVHNPLDLELTYDKVIEDNYVRLALRVDRYRIPGAILKAHLAEASATMCAELGRARLTRTQREDLRAMVVRRLKEKTMPSMTSHALVWDQGREIVRFFGTATATHTLLHDLFERTFDGLELVPEGAYTRAAQRFEDADLDLIPSIAPFALHHGDA